MKKVNKGAITGGDIKRIREALGLETFAFAAIIGVHASTVYRWETRWSARPSMEAFHGALLGRLNLHVRDRKRLGALGKDVHHGLMSDGPLGALSVMLNFLVGRKAKARRRP